MTYSSFIYNCQRRNCRPVDLPPSLRSNDADSLPRVGRNIFGRKVLRAQKTKSRKDDSLVPGVREISNRHEDTAVPKVRRICFSEIRGFQDSGAGESARASSLPGPVDPVSSVSCLLVTGDIRFVSNETGYHPPVGIECHEYAQCRRLGRVSRCARCSVFREAKNSRYRVPRSDRAAIPRFERRSRQRCERIVCAGSSPTNKTLIAARREGEGSL